MKFSKSLFTLFLISAILLVIAPYNASAKTLRGKVSIDGSSTVFPITEAVAEEFRSVAPRVKVIVGVSGTGGGFKKFLAGSIDINNASRRIKSKEVKKAKKQNIDFLEIPVAFDGITVVINKANDWAKEITPAELKKIWNTNSKVVTWKDVRSSWPDKKIKLYGPGTDSGTFDYFTKAINGKSRASRSNYTMSEDDNVLVAGVSGDKYALGYFGFAYYLENKTKINALPIKSKNGSITPSMESINLGTYVPLSRPIFIYARKDAFKKPEVKKFIQFYLEEAGGLVKDVGYVPLPKADYEESLEKIKSL